MDAQGSGMMRFAGAGPLTRSGFAIGGFAVSRWTALIIRPSVPRRQSLSPTFLLGLEAETATPRATTPR